MTGVDLRVTITAPDTGTDTGSGTGSGTGTDTGSAGTDSGSGSGGGGGGSTAATTEPTTETVTNADGSTTTTVTDTETGTVTQTTENTDGSTLEVTTTADGTTTTTETRVDEVIVTTVGDSDGNISGTVEMTSSYDATAVNIPVSSTAAVTSVTIAVDTDTGEIIPLGIQNDDGSYSIVLENSTSFNLVENSKSFIDVSDDDWYADSVNFVSAREVMNGTSKDTFDADISLSRGMIAQIVYNLDTSSEAGVSHTFDDVTENHWYNDAVGWAASVGAVTGYGDGTFNGDIDVLPASSL